jgi:hypothetical protein
MAEGQRISMNVFVIASAAKQSDGDFVMHRVEKAFRTATKAHDYLRGKATTFREAIHTEFGVIECDCERGIFEVEVED